MPDYETTLAELRALEEANEEIERLRKRKEKRKKLISNIIAAKKDFSSWLTAGTGVLNKLSDVLGDDMPDILEEASEYMKDATNILEKTSIIIGLTKSAGIPFWLALVQILVEETKSSLVRQKEYVDGMIEMITQLRSSIANIKELLGGATDPEALLYAYEKVVEARQNLLDGKERFLAGGRLVIQYTDSASNHLALAEKRLYADIEKFNRIPSAAQFKELLDFLTAMYPAMARLAADYSIEYVIMTTLVNSIYFIDENILKNKELIDREVTANLIDKIVRSIDKLTKNPMERLQAGWRIKPPNQASILWNDLKFILTIKSHRKKIDAYFDNEFKNLMALESVNDDYRILVDELKGEVYVDVDRIITPPKEVRAVSVRVGVPSLDVIRLGEKSAVALNALANRSLAVLNSIRNGADRTLFILGSYGPYESILVSYINNSLKALGYEGNPISSFAKGELISVSQLSKGVPVVKTVSAAGTTITAVAAGAAGHIATWLSGKDYSDTIEEKNVSNAFQWVVNIADSIKEQANRLRKRNVENVMDEMAAEEGEKIEGEEELEDFLVAGLKGKRPDKYYHEKAIYEG